MKVDGAVQAYEYHDDWEFQLTATRYDLEDIKQTSIAKSVLRMVVMRSGKTSVQALYRVRCNDQRLELKMPEASEFDADPKIDGRSVTMEVGAEADLFHPAPGDARRRGVSSGTTLHALGSNASDCLACLSHAAGHSESVLVPLSPGGDQPSRHNGAMDSRVSMGIGRQGDVRAAERVGCGR